MANDRRPTRIGARCNEIGDFPNLIRKVEDRKRVCNHTWKCRFRQIGLAKYEAAVREIAASAGLDMTDVFGPWANWPGEWDADQISRSADFTDLNARDPWDDEPSVVKETVNIAALKRYAHKGRDRRGAIYFLV